eukprot:scaffold81806_cov28-Tisochrysis_lutea.AAC.1
MASRNTQLWEQVLLNGETCCCLTLALGLLAHPRQPEYSVPTYNTSPQLMRGVRSTQCTLPCLTRAKRCAPQHHSVQVQVCELMAM